jgi:hypothetical protein
MRTALQPEFQIMNTPPLHSRVKMQATRSDSYLEIKPIMKILKPNDYFLRLISNLELAIKNKESQSPETVTSLQQLGSFLYSRSTEFEMLQKQHDATIFLSVLKSNTPNVLHIFEYYFSGNAMMNNRKESTGKELLVMLDHLNEQVSGHM